MTGLISNNIYKKKTNYIQEKLNPIIYSVLVIKDKIGRRVRFHSSVVYEHIDKLENQSEMFFMGIGGKSRQTEIKGF